MSTTKALNIHTLRLSVSPNKVIYENSYKKINNFKSHINAFKQTIFILFYDLINYSHIHYYWLDPDYSGISEKITTKGNKYCSNSNREFLKITYNKCFLKGVVVPLEQVNCLVQRLHCTILVNRVLFFAGNFSVTVKKLQMSDKFGGIVWLK